MLNGINKVCFLQFNGFVQWVKIVDDCWLVVMIDIYDLFFGELQVILNCFFDVIGIDDQNMVVLIGFKVVMVFQKDMWVVVYLCNFRLEDLVKIGDSEYKQLVVEVILEVWN